MTFTFKGVASTEAPLNGSRTTWVFAALFLAACGGGNQQGGGPGGPGGQMPPMPVDIVTLEAKPVETTNEFVGVLKSRKSAAIQPQIEGFITRIAVRPGERVSQGTVLFEVDAAMQQAALGSQQSMRAARQAELEFAKQQAARARKLFEAGAASQRDAEEAESGLRAAEAQFKAADQQVTQQRAQLGYYKVTSPSSGTVGDIPVRVGDRVTSSSHLTTVDSNDGLEVNLSIPATQATHLRNGLEARVLDDAGQVATTSRLNFVASNVDDATQSILVKAPFPQSGGAFRADQFVKVRLVWSAEPGLTVPVTAVQRISGGYFAFVAEADGKGGFVAKQRAIQVGDIVGNAYVVKDSLKEGDKLITAGLQKIGDGSPVAPAAPAPPAAAGAAASPAAGKN